MKNITVALNIKNIIKKFTKGLSSLYGITSYFSDVLSYSRLMALCLSTGVIAQVVNLLGGLVGPIPAVIVGIIGHGFNLANSALGSYVHTSRLQYVEFFGKFYEGGGKEFSPFKYKNFSRNGTIIAPEFYQKSLHKSQHLGLVVPAICDKPVKR